MKQKSQTQYVVRPLFLYNRDRGRQVFSDFYLNNEISFGIFSPMW